MSVVGLPETYRFAVFNQTGITLSNVPTGLPRASGRRVRYDTTGTTSYEAAEFTFLSFAATTIGNNSYVTGSTLSNTVSDWLALDGLFSCFASGNASGTVYLFLETSPDGGTTWPTPASANGFGGGFFVGQLGYGSTTTVSTASTVQRLNFSYP